MPSEYTFRMKPGIKMLISQHRRLIVIALTSVVLVLLLWRIRRSPQWNSDNLAASSDAVASLRYFTEKRLHRSTLYQTAVRTLLDGNDPFVNFQKTFATKLNKSFSGTSNSPPEDLSINGLPLQIDNTFRYSANPQWLLQAVLDQGKNIDTVLEIGTYKGQSVAKMASTMKMYRSEDAASGYKFLLICLDTWLGSVVFWQRKGSHLKLSADGRPRLYEQFLVNVASSGHADVVLPLMASSVVGLKYLYQVMVGDEAASSGLAPPDFIFLDSSHEGNETSLELEESFRLLRPGGYLAGHDFTPAKWPEVVVAVSSFVQRHRERLVVLDLSGWRQAYKAGDCDLIYPEVGMESAGQDANMRMLICRKCLTCRENGLWIVQKLPA